MAPVFSIRAYSGWNSRCGGKDIRFLTFGFEHSDVVDVGRSADSPQCKSLELQCFPRAGAAETAAASSDTLHWKDSERDTGEPTASFKKMVLSERFQPAVRNTLGRSNV